MKKRVARKTMGVLLEAEVVPRQQKRFEKRYQEATGTLVSPGSPEHYQDQANKWGSELRVYFNDPGLRAVLDALGAHVEGPRKGYKSSQYRFRVNDNKLWWNLVEASGLRLGPN